MSDVSLVLGGVVAVLGLVGGYLSSRRGRALLHVVEDFALVGSLYYSMRQDGWTAVEKDKLADAAIAFFDAVEGAGIEITRPA